MGTGLGKKRKKKGKEVRNNQKKKIASGVELKTRARLAEEKGKKKEGSAGETSGRRE